MGKKRSRRLGLPKGTRTTKSGRLKKSQRKKGGFFGGIGRAIGKGVKGLGTIAESHQKPHHPLHKVQRRSISTNLLYKAFFLLQ